MLARYSSIATAYFGSETARIRMASKAAFVELLIPTVATGTPLYGMVSFTQGRDDDWLTGI